MIREAKISDIPAIVDIAVESVSRKPIPVIIDRKAMAEEARLCLGPAHFMWVSEINGEVVGAVAASSHNSFWHQRLVCTLLLYYVRVPGDGLKLLKKFSEWVHGRPAIKVAVIEFEPETDIRLKSYMKRLGFTRESENLTFIRGAQ